MTETIQIKVPMWNIESETGYKPRTTFWQDFSIADAFGGDAVTDTFHRAFNEWKDNCVYITELVMVLNHKIAQWYEKTWSLPNFTISIIMQQLVTQRIISKGLSYNIIIE